MNQPVRSNDTTESGVDNDSTLLKRLVRASPVLIACAFHAIALNRWSIVGPAMIGIVIPIIRKSRFAPTSRHWYLAVGVGLLLGLLVPSSIISVGPLPPVLAAAITGIALAVAVFASLGNKTTVAWVSAWAILATSGKHAINGKLYFILLGFLAVSLIAVAVDAKLFKLRIRSALIFGFFGALTAISTFGVSMALKRIDRALVNTVENLMTQNPTWSITGLSNNITLSNRSQIKLSPQPLLELSNLSGKLRTKVMDDFDGQRWTTSTQLASTSHSLNEIKVLANPNRELEILFLEDINDVIPSPAGTYQVANAMPRVSGGWILQGEPDHVTVTIRSAENQTLPNEPEPAGSLTRVPEVLREGLGPIARQLTDPTKSNLENAGAVAAFFVQNFEYSLTTDLTGNDPPLVVLVQQRRPAYCVYFASAMAVMLRCQDIPARVVSGFVPHELNPLTGRVTIRERDSHAWVEVWSPKDHRYVAFDPTPGASRIEAIGMDKPESYLASLSKAVRSTIRRWWLIARKDPASMFWILVQSPYAWISLVILSGWCIIRLRRNKAIVIPDQNDLADPELREVYECYLRSLKEFGIAPKPWESDQELIQRLEDLGKVSLSTSANQFIDRYRATRYGGQALDSDLMKLAQRVSSLE